MKNCFKALHQIGGDQIVAKLAPRFDGPFKVTVTDEVHSTMTLNMPRIAANKCKVYHTSQVKPYIDPIINEDLEKADKKSYAQLSEPIQTKSGLEHVIERILEHHRKGGGYKFLMK
ncbi:hypothetical protein AN958_00029 [Leucoagaricus sp. SymC.cos]|nr:hypothetical protein AN958_00029 [Leucoagaricus sp. SymC.cos]